ncbi:ParB N-terminal domain-containing protein (plasmid) [Deinococcus sp. VB142]|uniref:ParB N-terminal domain-containing protein n=1 Tax=Deinococcus sp. VB142 TaxID=3112952 RepID=A0AAU6Q7W7_9DEIO
MRSEVDFNAMAEQTRAKMAEKAQGRKRSVKTDVLPRENQEEGTPAATGWWRGGGPAHWIHEGKALCGREMPANFTIGTTDPDHPDYQTNQCKKCVKALDKQGDEAFASALAQSFRVRVRATGVEGTVPTGGINSKGTVSVRYDTYRYGDRNEVEFQPAELEVLPALTIGDRVFFATHPNRRAATIVGDYSAEGLPLSVKLEYDDGEKGGGHVGNLLRFIDDVPQQEPVEEASGEEAAPEPAPAPAELPGTPVLLPGLQLVPWSSIRPSRLNPRKHFDPDALKELAASIYAKGLQQNLVVRPHPTEAGAYEIAAGERRYRAIGLLVDGLNLGTEDTPKWAELPTDHPVPVLVRHMTDLELLETATAENVQRRRMTPLEEADAFAALIDHGATPKDVASKFGYTQRTVVRRVQISRGLAPLLRDDFNAGKLSLAQAEVLVLLGPELQEAVWGNFRRSPDLYDAAHIRKHVGNYLFQVKHAQFPRNWYTGGVSADDLFGDVPQHFLDSKQALELQLKHARHLADKDVEKGAPFADVILGPFADYLYSGKDGQGVAYAINATTGEMKRYENLAPRHPWAKQPHYRAQGKDAHATTDEPVQTYGKGELQFQGPKQVISGRYQSPGKVAQTLSIDFFTEIMESNCHLFNAMYVADSLMQEYHCTDLPGVAQALAQVDDLRVLDEDGRPLDEYTPETLIEALMTLEPDALTVLVQGFMVNQIEAGFMANAQLTARIVGRYHRPFKLTDEYLKDCDTAALEEIWDDAGMGDRENTTPQYLRAMLLEEADRLAGEGFLPRPLRSEVLASVLEKDGEEA